MDRLGDGAEDAVNGGRRLQFSLVLLAATIAVGAYLRFDRLGEPSYWLDEILHQHLTDFAASKRWWQWFGRIHEEHAGLYYLTQLAMRVFGKSELAGRLASALFGLATIPLLWLVPLERRARGAAMILLAVSPLHVYYSREARGYALLTFLTAALVLILLRRRSVVVACVVLLALVYSSAVASTVVASAAVVSFLIALFNRDRRRWYATVGGCASVALALFRVIYASRPVDDAAWPGFPPIDWRFLTSLARMASVTALGAEIGGRTAVAMLAFAVIGAFAIAKHDRAQAIVLIGMTVLPLAITLAALRFFHHFFAARYVLASLIGYILLAGIGIASIARIAPHPASTALAIAAITAAQGWGAARTESFQKLDWRGIAATLRHFVHPGDVILTAEPWSELSLRYYVGEIPNVRLIHAAGVGIAEIVLHDSRATWLVTAGASGGSAVRTWMCRYPLMLASPLQGFRMHYAPSMQDFLVNRSEPAEQRAVSTALGPRGFTLRLGPDDDVVLGDGWAGADVSRWAVGRRATLTFPRGERRDRVVRFHAYPLTHPTLRAQTLRVSLNGTAIADLTLAPEWRDYAVEAAAALWIDGMNRVTFDFGRATAPAALDPSSPDRRELATNFEWISIDDVGVNSTNERVDAPLVSAIRIGADHFIDERTAWRNTPTRFPRARLRRDFVDSLLGRLGFDPVTTWPRLASGEVRLDDVVETIAYGGDCESHETFLRRAFAILLKRSPSQDERSDLLGRLQRNPSRVAIVGRIVKSDEFRNAAITHRWISELSSPSRKRGRQRDEGDEVRGPRLAIVTFVINSRLTT